MKFSLDIADIRRAADRLHGQVVRTPLAQAHGLSETLGCQLCLKLETLQVTNAFKVRGALNRLLTLSERERTRGVIALSAGNHAQAVAYHATRLGIPAVVVMPETTPWTKVERTRNFGAEVELSGATLDAAGQRMQALIDERGLTKVHPYDDPDVIAGQGTIGLELVEQVPELDCLIVPVGGGGLVTGVATAVKAQWPKVQIVGVQLDSHAALKAALDGTRADCGGTTLAEGIAVKSPGKIALALAPRLIDDIVLVRESHIEQAITDLLASEKVLAEGAGAAGVAALQADPDRWRGRKVATIVCGGNIEQRVLASLIARQLARQGRVVKLRFHIEDKPGTLGQVASELGALKANILEVYHARDLLDVPAKGAVLDIVVETRGARHIDDICAHMREQAHIARISVLDAR